MLFSLEVQCPGIEQSSPVDSMTLKARSAVGEWCDVEEQSEEKRSVSQHKGDGLATDISVRPGVSTGRGSCGCVGDGELDGFGDNEVHH